MRPMFHVQSPKHPPYIFTHMQAGTHTHTWIYTHLHVHTHTHKSYPGSDVSQRGWAQSIEKSDGNRS